MSVAAALFTLGFLVAGWAAVTMILAALDDSGAKIMAALKGQSLLAAEPVPMRPVTVRLSSRSPTPKVLPIRASVEWRAAA